MNNKFLIHFGLLILIFCSGLKSSEIELNEQKESILDNKARTILNRSFVEEEQDVELFSSFVLDNIKLKDSLIPLSITKRNILW